MSVGTSVPRRYLERELEVLAAPDEQAGVVGAQLQKVGAVNGEQAAGVGRRPETHTQPTVSRGRAQLLIEAAEAMMFIGVYGPRL